MNKLFTYFFVLFFIYACNKDKNENEYPNIKIGTEETSIS